MIYLVCEMCSVWAMTRNDQQKMFGPALKIRNICESMEEAQRAREDIESGKEICGSIVILEGH